ncbi:MAG: esterase [Roseobacter sp.]|nr:esterase [Roseobacter sp.]
MTDEFNAAMRRAGKLVRAGNPKAATEAIQNALGAGGLGSMAKGSKSPFGKAKIGRGLRETLSGLAPSTLNGGDSTEPDLPEGATFDSGSFSCSAGSRDYRLYIPNLKGSAPTGLVMMLHGCKQSPVDFAKGTGMNQLAEAHGLIVVYPAQSRMANMQNCWKWFDPADQMRGAGEPAILAGLMQQLQRDHAIPQGRSFVAGLSAGAAMAVVLGQTYRDVFDAVGAHSGLPYRAAHDVPSAFAAMGQGATGSDTGDFIPTIIFQGDADTTVSAANADAIAKHAPKGPEVLDDGNTGGRRFSRRSVLAPKGHVVMEQWTISGLGHAWSGGNSAGSYTDPAGPDASREMLRFFLDLPTKGA